MVVRIDDHDRVVVVVVGIHDHDGRVVVVVVGIHDHDRGVVVVRVVPLPLVNYSVRVYGG